MTFIKAASIGFIYFHLVLKLIIHGNPLKKYISEIIDKHDNEPDFYYDSYDPDSLQQIMQTQKEIIEYQKNIITKTCFKY